MQTIPQVNKPPVTHRINHWLGGIILTSSLLLTACGGSSKDETVRPVATVQLSAELIDPGQELTLTGSSSTATGGTISAYSWEISLAPDTSEATITSADQAVATFSPEVPGNYEVCLTVSVETTPSVPDCEAFVVANPDPVASIAPVSAREGQQIQLDATGSIPPTNGDPSLLSYEWELMSTPEGSSASFDDISSSRPRITTDLEGNYEVKLTVFYAGRTNSVQTTLSASHVNSAPVPVVDITGGDINAWELGQTVTLDASGTVDDDGDDLQYRWRFSSNGTPYSIVGSSAVINNADQPVATFTPDTINWFNLQLTVFDGTQAVTTSTYRIVVSELPEDHVNTAPVAKIAPFFATGTYEFETGSSAYISTSSYDKETRSAYSLITEIQIVEAPEGFDIDATNEALLTNKYTTFTALEGDYRVSLRVSDGELWSETVYQTVTALTGANNAPSAVAETASRGRSFLVGSDVEFDAGFSTDDRDSELSAFEWKLTDVPDGSTATLTGADTANPTLVPDVAGPYSVTLNVKDSLDAWSGDTRPITILAKTQNNEPVARPEMLARYTETQPFAIYPIVDPKVEEWSVEADYRAQNLNPYEYRYLINPTVEFVGDAFDPDGDSLVYLWKLVDEPADNVMARPLTFCLNGYTVQPQGTYTTAQELYEYAINVREWECSNVSISPTAAGTYNMELTITDGMAVVEPITLSLEAVDVDQYPTLLFEDLYASEINGLDTTPSKYEYYNRQQVFPYLVEQQRNFPIFDSYLELNTEHLIKRYKLTAFDQDYTIEDLEALSQNRDYGYQVRFDGIEEGTVIKQGESVEFDLILITDEQFPASITETIYDQFGNAYTSYTNQGLGVRWKFKIAEREGWTFEYVPYLYPSNCYHQNTCN